MVIMLKKLSDMGEKIVFAHIKDGNSKNSDQAITGSQQNQLGKDILGLTLKSGDTKFDSPTFVAIEYNGVKKIKDKIKPPTILRLQQMSL